MVLRQLTTVDVETDATGIGIKPVGAQDGDDGQHHTCCSLPVAVCHRRLRVGP